jgi:hypothetical protein
LSLEVLDKIHDDGWRNALFACAVHEARREIL